MSIGTQIKNLRESLNMTPEAFARQVAFIPACLLARIEAEEEECPIRTLFWIKDSIFWLTGKYPMLEV